MRRCLESVRERRARSGISILLVIICLIVITTIVGAMLRNLVLVNRQAKQQMHASQAAWLADSGLERAVFFLRQDSDYRGETWIAGDELFGTKTGHVEIEVDADPNGESFVIARVVATFPHGATFAVKARREARIAISEQVTVESNSGDDQDATQ